MADFIGNQPDQQSNEMQKNSWDKFTSTDGKIREENLEADVKRTKSQEQVKHEFTEKKDIALASFHGKDTASLYNPSLDYIKNIISP